jgi:hypothetical protein
MLPVDAQSGVDLLDYLKDSLDDVCCRLADKFGLYDRAGRSRKAFIMDSLFRFSCPGCLWKVFTRMRTGSPSVDSLYMEMHRFAVNILTGVLAQALDGGMINVCCEDAHEFGRVDVVVKQSQFGAMVEANGACIVVEVKTGRSLSFAQLFRYLLQHRDATLIVWRVPMRQVFVLRGERLRALLCLYVSSAVARALRLLEGEHATCNHNISDGWASTVSEPQRLLDEFFDGLVKGLPRVVSVVFENLRGMGCHVS